MSRKAIITSLIIAIVGAFAVAMLAHNFSTANPVFGNMSSTECKLQNPSKFQKITDFSETTKGWRKAFWTHEISRYERELSTYAEVYEKVKYLRKTILKLQTCLLVIEYREKPWFDKAIFTEFRHQVEKIIDSYECRGAHFHGLCMANPETVTLTFLRGAIVGPAVKILEVQLQTPKPTEIPKREDIEGKEALLKKKSPTKGAKKHQGKTPEPITNITVAVRLIEKR